MSSSVSCPLCSARHSYPLSVAGKRYHRCLDCELVWLDEADHLDDAAEKAVYDGHDNRVDDPRYRGFLMRAFGEVLSRVSLLPVASISAAVPGLPSSPWGGRRALIWRVTTSSMPTSPSCSLVATISSPAPR